MDSPLYTHGSSFLAIKISIDTIPPLLSAGIRFMIAGSALYSIYLVQPFVNRHKTQRQEVHEHIGKAQWRDAIILGALLMVGGQGILTWGARISSVRDHWTFEFYCSAMDCYPCTCNF